MGKIVVTGGAGFIGSHLCRYLIDKGKDVVCIDNLFTGSKKNIEDLCKLDYKIFRFIQHNIINPMMVYENVDEIYNLACPASPIHYQHNPIRTLKANVIGSMNMLGLAKAHNAKILQASTSEVYGNPLEHPQKESYWGNVNPIGPRSCYDEGKRAAETLFVEYKKAHNLDIRIARIFNTYGSNMAKNDGRVVSNFIIQALNDDPITIYGDGKQTRSFCYVSDLVIGLVNLMGSGYKEPVNLGNPKENTILSLARLIKKLTNSKSIIVHKDLPKDDPVNRKPDISKARKILGWEPKVLLKAGLKKTIEYFRGLK